MKYCKFCEEVVDVKYYVDIDGTHTLCYDCSCELTSKDVKGADNELRKNGKDKENPTEVQRQIL